MTSIFSKLSEFAYEYLSLRLLKERLFPPSPKDKEDKCYKEPSSFFIWFIAVHTAAFGLASSRYEARKDAVETQLTVTITQLYSGGSNFNNGNKKAREAAIERIIELQQSKIPRQPIFLDLTKPLLLFDLPTSYLSLVLPPRESREIINEAKKIIRSIKSDLNSANLRNINLSTGNFKHSQMQWANLTNAKLVKTDFEGSNFDGAILIRTDLRKANLRRSYFYKATLFEADLQNARFDGADLRYANLSKAKLKGANLNQAKLQGADLTDANLEGVYGLNCKKLEGALYSTNTIFPKGMQNCEEMNLFDVFERK